MIQDKFTETELQNLEALWRQMSMVKHYSLHGAVPLADSVPGLVDEVRRQRADIRRLRKPIPRWVSIAWFLIGLAAFIVLIVKHHDAGDFWRFSSWHPAWESTTNFVEFVALLPFLTWMACTRWMR